MNPRDADYRYRLPMLITETDTDTESVVHVCRLMVVTCRSYCIATSTIISIATIITTKVHMVINTSRISGNNNEKVVLPTTIEFTVSRSPVARIRLSAVPSIYLLISLNFTI